MDMSKTRTNSGRRDFLKSAAVAGGAAVAGAAAGAALAGTAVEPVAADADSPARREGYRLTPHIETYYRLARD